MIKKVKKTYGGMLQDASKSKNPETTYFDATYGRITATNSSTEHSFTNEQGTKLELTIPNITLSSRSVEYDDTSIPVEVNLKLGLYDKHVICGNVTSTHELILFVASKHSIQDEYLSSIWKYVDSKLEIIYVNNLKFNFDTYITAICNYETDKIEKIYWVDGVNQTRTLNLRHSLINGDREDLIHIEPEMLNSVSPFNMSQPLIKDLKTGGNHTAGMIQYAYNLYKVNGSQTSLSPFSEQVSLRKTNEGGSVNEVVNTLPVVEISNIDSTFDNIIVYSIKYTSRNEMPVISVIKDIAIPDSKSLTLYDTNNIIRTVSVESFMFLGSSILIPDDIVSKDNIMFMSNYKEKNFIFKKDMRAFSFNSSKVSEIYHNVKSLTSYQEKMTITTDFPDNNDGKFDSINLDYDKFTYQSNGSTLGGTGKYCEFTLSKSSVNNGRNRYFKDSEIYRLGITFFNKYGKSCEPIWISDFKAPYGNLSNKYNTLDFKLSTAFYNEVLSIEDDYNKPIGYKLLIAERGPEDSSIITSGMLTTMMVNFKGSSSNNFNDFDTRVKLSKNEPKSPNFLVRNVNKNKELDNSLTSGTYPVRGVKDYHLMSIEKEAQSEVIVAKKFGGRTWQYNKMMQLYSPELLFNKNITIPNNSKIRIKGALGNTYNAVYGKEINVQDQVVRTSAKGYNGLSSRFSEYAEAEVGEEYNLLTDALIANPTGSDPDAYARVLWYRQYGTNPVVENSGSEIDEFGYIKVNLNSATVLDRNTNSNTTIKTSSMSLGRVVSNIFITEEVKKLRFTYKNFKITCNINSFGGYDYKFISESGNAAPVEITGSITEGESETLDFGEPSVLTVEEFVNNYDNVLNVSIKPNIKHSWGDVDYELVVESLDTEDKVLSSSSLLFTCRMEVSNESGKFQVYFEDISADNKIFDIYGTPEFTEKGQSYKNYANVGELRYSNNLLSFKTDGPHGWKNAGTYGRRIVSVNSDNNNCLTLVVDNGTVNENYNFESYESLYSKSGLNLDKAVMYAEIVRSDEDIYLGGLYGGNRYEDKLRTRYREIGDYKPLTSRITNRVSSPGDTYVQVFKFLRIVKREDIFDQGTYLMEEIVEYPCETTVDLINRNDESIMAWDSKLSYDDDKYHKYNQVYSQTNNLKIHQASEYYTKDEELFGATVIASKKKTAGELIDNWLNINMNDSLSLDGKFGDIQKMIKFNDVIFTFQNKAISTLNINPRVQIPTDDGLGLELGTGQVIPNYNYLTQSSGTEYKYSIVQSPYGIYYYDNINKTINMLNGQVDQISEKSGLHSLLQNKPLKELNTTLHRTSTGIISGYDPVNKDMYMTFNYKGFTETLIFNEKHNMFTNRHVHRVNDYIMSDDRLLATQDLNDLHRYTSGIRNVFFNKKYPTTIKFMINPEVDLDTIINTIQFKSEVYNNGKDLPNNTITSYRVYNEFQDTGTIPILSGLRGNTRRFMRDWNITVARNKGTRERVRNPWNFLELNFENTNNLELVLHDIMISYTV